MKEGLLSVERMILESLVRKEKTLEELSLDTKLDQFLIINSIQKLLIKNFVSYDKGIYFINKKNIRDWKDLINLPVHLKSELEELFAALVNDYFKKEQKSSSLKLKKVWMTQEEESIFSTMLYNVESFLKSLTKDNDRQVEKLADQKVILWGISNYSSLLHSMLEMV